jgi:hypothetical protein
MNALGHYFTCIQRKMKFHVFILASSSALLLDHSFLSACNLSYPSDFAPQGV